MRAGIARRTLPLSAMNAAMRAYYDARAAEYDEWWLGTGLFARRVRPGWQEDVDALCTALSALPPARTLDVACGTGFLTRRLPGDVTGLDQSAEMVEIAAAPRRPRRPRLPPAASPRRGDGPRPERGDGGDRRRARGARRAGRRAGPPVRGRRVRARGPEPLLRAPRRGAALGVPRPGAPAGG